MRIAIVLIARKRAEPVYKEETERSLVVFINTNNQTKTVVQISCLALCRGLDIDVGCEVCGFSFSYCDMFIHLREHRNVRCTEMVTLDVSIFVMEDDIVKPP